MKEGRMPYHEWMVFNYMVLMEILRLKGPKVNSERLLYLR